MHITSSLRLGAIVALLFLGACRMQAYRPVPLRPEAHVGHVAARSAGAQEVAAYAAALARLDAGAPGPFNPDDGLTLAEAEVVALVFHPELRLARLEARVPALAARHAGVAEDPELEFDVLKIVESVAKPWVLGGSLSFTVPLSGRLRAERAAAHAEAGAAQQAARVAEGRVLATLREAWNRWTHTGERLSLVGDYALEVDALLGIAKLQGEAQQIGEAELGALELARLEREDERNVLLAEHERQSAAIRRAMGLAPQAPVDLVPGFGAAAPPANDIDETVTLRQRNLELAEAHARYAAAESTLALEMQKQHPDLHLGPATESDGGSARVGVVGGISLPLWNANRQGVAEALGRRDAARGAYEVRLEVLAGDLSEARADVARAKARQTWIQERLAPRAERQLAALRKLSELGEMDVLLLQGGLGALFESKAKLLDLRADEAQAEARVRALIAPLETPLWLSRERQGCR